MKIFREILSPLLAVLAAFIVGGLIVSQFITLYITPGFEFQVVDRLLEEPWLHVEAISGTSAGAMNAAVLASGWTSADFARLPRARVLR